MKAFHNIIYKHQARSEYLNQDQVLVRGELREQAIEAFYKERLGIFNQ